MLSHTQAIKLSENIHIIQPFIGPFNITYSNDAIFLEIEKLVLQQQKKYSYNGQVTASAFVNCEGKTLVIQTQNIDISKLSSEVTSNLWQECAEQWREKQHPLIDSYFFKNVVRKLPEIMEKEGVCIREGLKKSVPILSGTGYELCSHCQPDNHSEAQALYTYFNTYLQPEFHVKNEANLFSLIDNIDSGNEANLKLIEARNNLKNSTVYLWGHWWSCKDCGRKMEKVGVKNLIISKKWTQNNINIIPASNKK